MESVQIESSNAAVNIAVATENINDNKPESPSETRNQRKEKKQPREKKNANKTTVDPSSSSHNNDAVSSTTDSSAASPSSSRSNNTEELLKKERETRASLKKVTTKLEALFRKVDELTASTEKGEFAAQLAPIEKEIDSIQNRLDAVRAKLSEKTSAKSKTSVKRGEAIEARNVIGLEIQLLLEERKRVEKDTKDSKAERDKKLAAIDRDLAAKRSQDAEYAKLIKELPETSSISAEITKLQKEREALEAQLAEKVQKKKEIREKFMEGNKDVYAEINSVRKQIEEAKKKKKELSNELKKYSNAIASYDIYFPSDIYGAILGKGGATINEIRNSTLAEIKVSSNSSKPGQGIAQIRGAQEAAAEAKTKIEELVKLHYTETTSVRFNMDFVGEFLGKKGSNIMQVQKDTGASLDIDKDAGVIHIRGKPEQIKAAKAYIGNFLRARSQTELKVNPDLFGIILGRNGAILKQIQNQVPDVRIKLDKPRNVVLFEGKPDSIKKAKESLEKLLSEMNANTVELRFPEELLGMLLGKGGSNLKRIEQETGVAVNIEKLTGILRLHGTKEGVEKAREQFEETLRNHRKKAELTVSFEAHQLGGLIGKGGSTISAIRKESGVDSIDIDKTAFKVKVSGSHEACMKATELIRANLRKQKEELEQARAKREKEEGTAFVIQFEPQFTGALFGERGATIQRIQRESGAKVRIDKDKSQIAVRGEESTIDAARKMIEEVIETERARLSPSNSNNNYKNNGEGNNNNDTATAVAAAAAAAAETTPAAASATAAAKTTPAAASATAAAKTQPHHQQQQPKKQQQQQQAASKTKAAAKQ